MTAIGPSFPTLVGLRAGELVDRVTGILGMRPVTSKRMIRQIVRVLRAHTIEGFDGVPLVPSLVFVEVAPAVVAQRRALFTEAQCRVVASAVAAAMAGDGTSQPHLTVRFEENAGLTSGFRVAVTAFETGADNNGSTVLTFDVERLDVLWRRLDRHGGPARLAALTDVPLVAITESRRVRQSVMLGHDGTVGADAVAKAAAIAEEVSRALALGHL